MSTILFVDDDVLFLRALTTQLDFPQLGYDRALTANGVDQAVQILNREPVDVMVCDIEMPEKSGMELAHYVAEQGLKIVLLLLTCHSSFDYAKEAIGLDVFDYLLKPIRMEVLQERLVEALQRKKEMDWLAEYRQELSDLPPVGDRKGPGQRVHVHHRLGLARGGGLHVHVDDHAEAVAAAFPFLRVEDRHELRVRPPDVFRPAGLQGFLNQIIHASLLPRPALQFSPRRDFTY